MPCVSNVDQVMAPSSPWLYLYGFPIIMPCKPSGIEYLKALTNQDCAHMSNLSL